MTNIKDVAKLANVSTAAVSRYLNGTLKPREETIKRIEAAIAETNYIPNRMAASIRTKTSNTIAIVIPASKNITFAEIAEAINDEITQYGYSMVTYTTNDKLELEKLASSKIRENRADGAIFITEPKGDKDMSHIDLLEESGIKTLLINRFYAPSKYHGISYDCYKGARDTVRYLKELGYRKIGLVIGWDNQDQSELYRQAYIDQHHADGEESDSSMIVPCNFVEQETKKVVQELLDKGADAVFTINDRLSLIALEVIEANNLKVGEDVGVVGYGNTQFSKLVKLTSVDGNGELIGKKAATMLLDMLRGIETRKFELLPTSLVIRQSTRKI